MMCMKKTMILILVALTSSCSILKRPLADTQEEGLIITRKYAGEYLEHRQTGPENYDGPNLLWIKTTMEDEYGKISAYGRRCDFVPGERLYLRRTFYSPGIVSGYWVYYIENDAGISYRATDIQHDRAVYIMTWFE
jgi:hypothetical protein